MSMHASPIEPVPEETARVARAAFRKGNLLMRIRDEIGILYDDQMFASLYDARGQLAISPWRLALVTVFQFLENLSDRQAAEAVRSRIDLKYALSLELGDPGFDFSVLCEFRARLLAGGRDQNLLEVMLEHLHQRGLVKARGKQRTDSTHGSRTRAAMRSGRGWPPARATSTPRMSNAVLYVNASPGWWSSGMPARIAIHSSGGATSCGCGGP